MSSRKYTQLFHGRVVLNKVSEKMILKALQLRFSRVPVLIQKQVQQVQDDGTLVSLYNIAILCQSLEEFKEKLP